MATVTGRNGTDVRALLETIEAIRAKPEPARFTFRPAATRDDGTHLSARIGSFVHAGAELGCNLGPNAVQVKKLCSYVQETPPVRDVLANGVPVTTAIEVLA